ncbi:MAG: hypothetical protein Q9173_000376 [Seirophora scorigena]
MASPAQVASGPHRATVPTIDSRQARPLVVAVVFTSIATSSVILRFIAKRINRSKISLDDYFIVASLFFIYALMTCNIIGVVRGGVGLHMYQLPHMDFLTVFLKALIGVQLAWTFALMFCKFSLLTFYVRIFAIRTFRILAYMVAAIVSAWALSVFLETFLLCRPFAYNWDPTITDFTCGNRNAAYIAAGSLNIVTDIMVLCLPIPMVWNLQIPRRNKAILTAVFGMGLFVCIVSILRLIFLVSVSYTDITWTVTDPLLWSMLEPCVGVSCACIPLMRPLLSRAFPDRLSRRANKYGEFKDRSPENSNGSSNNSNKKRFAGLKGGHRHVDDGTYPLTSTSGGTLGVTTNEISSVRNGNGKGEAEAFSLEDLEAQRGGAYGGRTPRDGISVKKEWRVQHV